MNDDLDSGDKSEDGLRRVREKGEEISGRHEGSDECGSGTKTEQANCDWVRGCEQSFGACETPHG